MDVLCPAAKIPFQNHLHSILPHPRPCLAPPLFCWKGHEEHDLVLVVQVSVMKAKLSLQLLILRMIVLKAVKGKDHWIATNFSAPLSYLPPEHPKAHPSQALPQSSLNWYQELPASHFQFCHQEAEPNLLGSHRQPCTMLSPPSVLAHFILRMPEEVGTSINPIPDHETDAQRS